MKAIGIIAEYNPITNGHIYHLKTIKDKYPDYAIVLVLSGSFTQRGEPTIIDKWKRCELALKMGVDLVIELPYSFATEAADFFAYGGVTILEKLKVERIIFGSESDDVESLELIAKTQLDNFEFDKLVKIYSKLGNNYPTAISNAIYDLTNKKITTPNDLLGVSYIKTILKNNYNIKYETIHRINNYHDDELNSISSATSIREALKNNDNIKGFVPDEELGFFNNLHYYEDYYNLLKYKIITDNDLSIYQSVDEGIDKVLKREISNSNDISELIERCKSKRYTYNKISRMLCHILCNYTKDMASKFHEVRYLRILGLNNMGRLYLNSIKKEIDIPIISKVLRNKDEMLEYELDVTKIYDIPHNENLIKNEFNKIIYIGDKDDKK